LADKCWGKFYQGFNREVTLNVSCKGNEGSNKKKYRHAGNCILHIDIEGDGDLDFLGGNISFKDAQLLYNNGSGIINAQDTIFTWDNHTVNMPFWVSPFHVDIDNDNKLDLLLTPHTDNLLSANYHNTVFYKNAGTNSNPNFIYVQDSLLTSDMIDVGSYSHPTFFDYDKDGKLDLFVGTEGYVDNGSGNLIAKLAYYRNVSTSGNIAFELVTKDFLNLSSKTFPGIFPTFGDATGDGIDDLVFGNANGYISIYKNFASSNNATPNFMTYEDSLPNVFVNGYSKPLVFDFNQDGKTDLLIGSQGEKLHTTKTPAVHIKN
jgi:FG-GAP repeat.